MIVEVTLGTVVELTVVGGAVIGVTHWLFSAALKDRDARIAALEEKQRRDAEAAQKAWDAKERELEGAFRAARETQATLFGKIDQLRQEHADYKLTVAEKYVAVGALKELLAPITSRLESIEHDLRNGGARVAA